MCFQGKLSIDLLALGDFRVIVKCFSWPAALLAAVVCSPPHCSYSPNFVIDLVHFYEKTVNTQLYWQFKLLCFTKAKRLIVWFSSFGAALWLNACITWKIQGVWVSLDSEVQLALWIQLVLSLYGNAVKWTHLHHEYKKPHKLVHLTHCPWTYHNDRDPVYESA